MKNKIVIIGCGQIGRKTAKLLMSTALYYQRELNLILLGRSVSEYISAIAEDIQQAHELDFYFSKNPNYNNSTVIYSTNPMDLANAEIIIIAAGHSQYTVEFNDRLAELPFNVSIIADYAGYIKNYAPNAFVISVTSPVDLFTWYLKEALGFEANKVIGIGSIIDMIRYRLNIKKNLARINIPVNNCHALAIGPHSGSDMILLNSSIYIDGKPIYNLIKSKCIAKKQLNNVLKQAKIDTYNHGLNLAKSLTSSLDKTASELQSSAICQIVKEYFNLQTEKTLVPVSLYCTTHYTYEISDVCIGVATIIDNAGAKLMNISLDYSEKNKLICSAAKLKILKSQLGSLPSLLNLGENLVNELKRTSDKKSRIEIYNKLLANVISS